MGTLRQLFDLIAAGDDPAALAMLKSQPDLAGQAYSGGATRQDPNAHFFPSILHYAYEGDTALHLAAAAHSPALAEALIALRADVAAQNRRKAQPLHYAVDGGPGLPGWRPTDQAMIVSRLIAAGADPNAPNQGGVTPLHRAVRNRCAGAVEALLAGGADPGRKNAAGSTPLRLAEVTSGRGGTGSPQAKAQQAAIVALLERALSAA